MGKKTKTGKARKDRFYYLAKETGYRSRAAFKLIQLNRRFNFLNSSKILIDLCAAPGGWLQVAAKEMPVASQIIGVDLVPIQPIPRVKTFVADITTEKCKQAFALATSVLRKGGWFVTKMFRSRDYEPFKWALSHFFRTVRAVKPEASRLESAEIFLIGQSYLAPDRIDSRFLDVRHVFGEVEQPPNRSTVVNAFLKETKKKKKAEGYADDDPLYHELLVSDFIQSSDPLEALAKANKIIFDLPEVANHPLTTDAIKADLEDIQVLGKGDIKSILKWRKKLINALNPDSNKSTIVSTEPANKSPAASSGEEDGDLKVEEEVQRLLHEESKQQKKRLKRVRKAKIKAAERLVLQMDHTGDRIEQEDGELFALSTLHELAGLEKANVLIGDTSVTGSDAMVREQQALALKQIRAKRNAELRTAIEGAERTHFERRGDSIEVPDSVDDNSRSHEHRNDLYLSSDSDTEDVASDNDQMPSVPDSDSDSGVDVPKAKRTRFDLPKRPALPTLNHFEQLRKKQNPLLVDLDDENQLSVDKQKVQSWVSSDEMKDLLGPMDDLDTPDDSSEADDTPDLLNDTLKEKKKKKKKRVKKVDVNPEPAAELVSLPKNSSTIPPATGADHLPPELRGMKKLRRPLTVEERALATRLIQSAKSRRELIESGYHRFQFFEEPSQLPDWFVEDEKRHMRKPLPLKTEELVPDRPTMGRSISKVEEAKLRKKARLAKRLKRIRQKAEDISDDVPESEKWHQIKQMYKKAGLLGKKRRPVQLIVNTKAGAKNPREQAPKGAKVKIVDRRMKADLRGQQRSKGKKNNRRAKRPVNLMAHKPHRRGRK